MSCRKMCETMLYIMSYVKLSPFMIIFILDIVPGLLNKTDCIPCHAKNKLLLYHRFVVSKVSWHLTIANFSKTWVVENVDDFLMSMNGLRCQSAGPPREF